MGAGARSNRSARSAGARHSCWSGSYLHGRTATLRSIRSSVPGGRRYGGECFAILPERRRLRATNLRAPSQFDRMFPFRALAVGTPGARAEFWATLPVFESRFRKFASARSLLWKLGPCPSFTSFASCSSKWVTCSSPDEHWRASMRRKFRSNRLLNTYGPNRIQHPSVKCWMY